MSIILLCINYKISQIHFFTDDNELDDLNFDLDLDLDDLNTEEAEMMEPTSM